MKEELEDEISAIDAIYPGSTEELAPQIFKFQVPNNEDIELQLSFPEIYPDEKPSIIQVISNRHSDVNYLQQRFDSKLEEVYRKGEVCMFEFLSELEMMMEESSLEQLESLKIEEGSDEDKKEDEEEEEESEEEEQIETQPVIRKQKSEQKQQNPFDGWSQSDPLVDRGSTFIGFARKVTSLQEAQEYLDLLVSDRKISKAAHNMSAWRIKGSGNVQYQDCDDDGEAAAGGRLLHLLTVCNIY
ncbi:protein IMPACT homolog [[Candida] jaroonii]|uniref:Protein IMPACT homolog n=1 Tax=[Candida] jaroonii TaxID=467808 RepID=A0ACA9YDB7_9ASCO|nr:protein IMPACT homolog [[Candida] jaroonii]